MVRIFMNGYSQNKGGVESYITNLCNNLDKSQFEVIYNMPEMTIDGKTWIRPKNRHNYIAYRWFWKRFYRENKFDVLYDNECDIVSIDQLKFAKRAGVPVRILHSHSSSNQEKVGYIHSIFEKNNRKNLKKYVTHFFACSQLAGKWMFGDESYRIIKNGINVSKYKFSKFVHEDIRKELHIQTQKVIGCVGRIEKVKNLEFAIDVISKIISQNNNTSLVIVGDGTLKTELEDEARRKGLDKNVLFLGIRNDINRLMSAFDCLLMPSLFEGLPFVLVEAQAAGLPCVVSSNVSKESDLTGLVKFVDLDAPIELWCDTIRKAFATKRTDTTQMLVDAGYSTEETAKEVSSIIMRSLRD